MRKIDSFTNKYSLSKTLRFRLIPVGKTEENFEKNYLKSDELRTDEYSLMKDYYDRYHKSFIAKVLSSTVLNPSDLKAYYDLHNSKENIDQLDVYKNSLRKQISDSFQSENFKKEYDEMRGKEMIGKLLPTILNESEKEVNSHFTKFSTYFTGFNQNRENIYSADIKHSTIAFRLIDENLVKYCNNLDSYNKIKSALSESDMDEFVSNMTANSLQVSCLTDVVSFNCVLSQKGITDYNSLVGGFVLKDGTKIKGINEYVNLYNQVHEKKERLPELISLYKQILSDREDRNRFGAIESDDILITEISDYYNSTESSLLELKNLMHDAILYKDGIAISTDAITDVSVKVYGSWDYLLNGYVSKYCNSKNSKKSIDVLKEEGKESFKKRKSYLISELEEYASCNNDGISGNIVTTIIDDIEAIVCLISEDYNHFKEYHSELKEISKDDNYVELIKNYLDDVKNLEKKIKNLAILNIDSTMNEFFYTKLISIFEEISDIDRLYNRVRNYITKKPYSDDKLKVNFDNPQLLGGWDKNKEKDYRSILLRDDNYYYLAIMDKSDTKVFINYPSDETSYYEKMEYKLLPGPNKMLPKVFFAKSNIAKYDPTGEYSHINKAGTFKKGKNFSKTDLYKMIDFFKKSLEIHEDWHKFNFKFKNTHEYNDISEFYSDISNQGYKISFVNVSKEYIDNLVENGKLYLFKIYNKDFSTYSKGNQNLHTMYFKMLFDNDNLNDVVYKLNGECEMFYRKASIEKKKPTHPANTPIQNKNPNNEKKQSVFQYDLVKDKRYTENQFYLHMPITMNYKEKSVVSSFNNEVKESIRNSEHNYVIGIDRGERNLVYISVIDETGRIVEQHSMNTIVTGNNYHVDYHQMLDEKEKERLQSRQNWKTIGNIKEIKEGYLSQVVHKICELVVKYDAMVSLENLNSGFKNSRTKIEKQVYDKFENMLIDKLNYLVLKNKGKNEIGGLLKAYQLTMPSISSNSVQNGIVFHIPAYLTSKIDPVTGFANFFSIKYTNVSDAQNFFKKFADIRYNAAENYFEFTFKYSDFGKTPDFKDSWTVCTYGERIITFRNKEKNSQWDNKEINLTTEYKNLFRKYDIHYESDLKNQIVNNNQKEFLASLLSLLKYTLQMRNSITGNMEVDYIISPVKNGDSFYDSRTIKDESLPIDADANGAYNIARKLLILINRIKTADNLDSVNFKITENDWMEYAQK